MSTKSDYKILEIRNANNTLRSMDREFVIHLVVTEYLLPRLRKERQLRSLHNCLSSHQIWMRNKRYNKRDQLIFLSDMLLATGGHCTSFFYPVTFFPENHSVYERRNVYALVDPHPRFLWGSFEIRQADPVWGFRTFQPGFLMPAGYLY